MKAGNLRILFALMVAGMLAGCGGPSLIKAEDPPALETPPGEPAVTEHWSVSLGAATPPGYRLEPALMDERVFAAGADGTVAAYDAASGERRWRQDLDVAITGAVGVGETGVAVGTANAEVVLLDPDSGAVKWRQRVSSEVLAPPAVGQGSVVVRTGDGGVFALEADTGEQRWLYRSGVPALSLRGHGSPVLVNGGVVVGFDNGRLAALELGNGDVAWEASVAVPEGRSDLERMVDLDADPAVAGGDVFAGAYQGRVAGIALANGQIAWTREVSVLGGISVDDSNVYVTDERGRLWAFDRRNGASVWRLDALEGLSLTAPRRYRDGLIVAGSDGYLNWIGRRDGALEARYAFDNSRLSVAPRVDGERIVVLDRRGQLRSISVNQQ
ncbi:outer membrane protein assembly factor BamB [Spiribacter roseus]|uniref:Outer membrane protein assembly factor BamB n=1 Tax=Spiribacter roseus TaxID=1855875 RepID=A0ABV3S027_9GAMM